MHTHWDDTPYDELPSQPTPKRPASASTAASAPTPPPDFAEDAKIPFMKLQGRWLRQMGFNVGSKLQIDASEGVITISIIGRPILPYPGVPRSLQRQIHHAVVEADTRQPILSGDPR
ncbi:SymE family type I addiction module toxin [uncultured Stenotrophomonas sp.]|uniref:SymE family type I addiction module toxin n=1 Tax=uncultured Stenotrophomonas sp. TaxID=165438 RepID=UPI0028ED824D|nr:SymE family type I addiction module toxin [uncultured Stenotrophomonas sp.]